MYLDSVCLLLENESTSIFLYLLIVVNEGYFIFGLFIIFKPLLYIIIQFNMKKWFSIFSCKESIKSYYIF